MLHQPLLLKRKSGDRIRIPSQNRGNRYSVAVTSFRLPIQQLAIDARDLQSVRSTSVGLMAAARRAGIKAAARATKMIRSGTVVNVTVSWGEMPYRRAEAILASSRAAGQPSASANNVSVDGRPVTTADR
jgi:hypothetical protein